MHVDTFLPTWKAWIFQATSLDAGPLHYVLGSHRATEGKLRWLFNRTRRYLTDDSVGRLFNRTRRYGNFTPTRYPAVLPYADKAFGFDPSIRFEGFEPSASLTDSITSALARFDFDRPTPIVTGEGWTLVIADTSGLHFRGWAEEGTLRVSTMVRSTMHNENWLPRKNIFFCDDRPLDC